MSYVAGMPSFEQSAMLGMESSVSSANKSLGLAKQQTLTAGSIIDSAARQVNTINANVSAATGTGRVIDITG